MKNKTKHPGGRLDGGPVIFKSMIDQQNKSFEHTCRVSPAHEAQDTPGLAGGQAKLENPIGTTSSSLRRTTPPADLAECQARNLLYRPTASMGESISSRSPNLLELPQVDPRFL